jgi:hypothetical protein
MGKRQDGIPALSVRQKLAEVSLGLDDRTIVKIYRGRPTRFASWQRVLHAAIELGLPPPPPPAQGQP